MRRIFVDMDGVLADFDRFVEERLGRTYDHNDNDQEMWTKLHAIPDFYLLLEPMADMGTLWAYLSWLSDVELQILTAIPRRTSMSSAEQNKRDWIAKYLGPEVVVKVGPYSRDKWKHARPGDILIDDRAENIKDWEEKGDGIGIFHTSAISTISQLIDIGMYNNASHD